MLLKAILIGLIAAYGVFDYQLGMKCYTKVVTGVANKIY